MITWLITLVAITLVMRAWRNGRRRRRQRQELLHITGAPVWWGKR